MSESPVTLRDAVRRRRANVAGGRRGDHRVKTSPEEEAVLLRLAAEQGVTVPRLLVESAMAGDRATAAERRDGIVELFAIRRLLAGVSNNVNQVAKKANAASDFPAEAAAVLDAVRRLVPRISAAAEALADPARGRDTGAGGRGTGR